MPQPGGPYSVVWYLRNISQYIQNNAWPSFPIGLVSGGYNSPSYINVINRVVTPKYKPEGNKIKITM
jgi:hypothetical protein